MHPDDWPVLARVIERQKTDGDAESVVLQGSQRVARAHPMLGDVRPDGVGVDHLLPDARDDLLLTNGGRRVLSGWLPATRREPPGAAGRGDEAAKLWANLPHYSPTVGRSSSTPAPSRARPTIRTTTAAR